MKTQLNWPTTALLLVDPQIDVLSPDGVLWDLLGEQITRRNTLQKLVNLRSAADDAKLTTFYSRIEIEDQDYDSWNANNPLQELMSARRMMVKGRGARFAEGLEPTAGTVLLSPRKGPSANFSDLIPQLRFRQINTLVIAGMIANLCVESHVRDAAEQGIRTIVCGDAIATTDDATHDASLNSIGMFATEIVDSEEVLEAFRNARQSVA